MQPLIHIAPGSAAAVVVPAQQSFRIINTEGGQVVDTWAFTSANPQQFLSMEHCRSALYKLWFEPGDCLVDNLFQPMFKFLDDTSPGIHDTLHAACSSGSYRHFGLGEDNPNCQDNLKQAMRENGVDLQAIPCPWNLFEHAHVDSSMRLADAPASATRGDYVELLALTDIMLVCSACPSTVGNISGSSPGGAAIALLDN